MTNKGGLSFIICFPRPEFGDQELGCITLIIDLNEKEARSK